MTDPRRIFVLACSMFVVATLVPACSTSGQATSAKTTSTTSDSPTPSTMSTTPTIVAACDLLVASVDLDTDLGQPGGGAIVELALGLAASPVRMVVIYLDPGVDDVVLQSFEAEVADRPGVRSTTSLDRAATYAAFKRLFAGNEEMLSNVFADDLPTSITAIVGSSDADRLTSWAEDHAHVYQVKDPRHPENPGDLRRWLERDDDRQELRSFADQLRAVDSHPSWAVVASEILDEALDDGLAHLTVTPDRVGQALESLAAQRSSC